MPRIICLPFLTMVVLGLTTCAATGPSVETRRRPEPPATKTTARPPAAASVPKRIPPAAVPARLERVPSADLEDSADAGEGAGLSISEHQAVTFAHQSSLLSAAAVGLLDRLAPMLRQAVVRLEGHADRSERDAAVLSLERARAVQRYLVGKGVPAERLQVRALAATQPLSSSTSQEARAGNRRVEIDVGEE